MKPLCCNWIARSPGRTLDWRPRWTLQQAVENTITWYLAWSRKQDMRQFTLQQIAQYEGAGRT